MPLVTFTSDFGVQTQGIGNMEAVIYAINPQAKVIHLMHGLPSFQISPAARTMETTSCMPQGYHVCVVDPGVGTNRKGIIIKTKRGDCLIGPDNGCLMTAPRMLGGIEQIVEIQNEAFMLLPVSPLFHGRHVFAPAAAHLSLGADVERFGRKLSVKQCVKAPYEEATEKNGAIAAQVIHINHYGSAHLNILHAEWDTLGSEYGNTLEIELGKQAFSAPFCKAFAEVGKGEPAILKDDYGRITVALNQGSFAQKHSAKVGDKITISKS